MFTATAKTNGRDIINFGEFSTLKEIKTAIERHPREAEIYDVLLFGETEDESLIASTHQWTGRNFVDMA